MRITQLETFIVSVPYRHREVSSRVQRDGVTDILVKLTADNGLVGWGESCSGADAASVEQAVQSAKPFVLGRDPWQTEAMYRDFFKVGLWDFRPMTGCFAFSGIDMALWDLCGKACGQPLYRLLGGALRETVDYFHYLAQGDETSLRRQCEEGVRQGYRCFYLKVGIDARAEETMLETVRQVIGPEGKIRIDANEAWSVPEAIRHLTRWHERFGIDFVEAPVPIHPVENMLDLRRHVSVTLCANEGLGRPVDVYRVIKSRCADVLNFSSVWVGSLRQFAHLSWTAAQEGQWVCKHTHGELGLAAAAAQHVLLSIPNAIEGNQQTCALMEDDILQRRLPIADGPTWGRIELPGLGVEVDEAKVAIYHDAYLRDGQFLPYQESQIGKDP